MADGYSGAGSAIGSAAGGAIGSAVLPGIGTAVGSTLGGIAGGAIGGMFGRKKRTQTQTQQQDLIDQLLASLRGEGPYSNLFAANEADFEKGFAAPARARFRNQIAPQIQQSYIAGGQQRSTGLEDTLTRAGVDMDQLLNEHYLQYQHGKEQNQINALNQILSNQGTGENQSYGSAAAQGLSGYLSKDKFGENIGDIFGNIFKEKTPDQQSTNAMNNAMQPLSKGYKP